jgi:integrase
MSEKIPTWQPSGPEGLYLNTRSGMYYSRYQMNGARTFRSLKTKVFTVAKLKHAKRELEVEKDRQRGATLDSNHRTLGGLLAEVKARLDAIPVAENTKIARAGNIERLRSNWQRGNFDTFQARNVTADVVAELREHLLHKAEWKWKFGKSKRRGFKPPVVNQTLWVLRVMLDIAVEKLVLIENPFSVSTTLRKGCMRRLGDRAGRVDPRLQLPDRADMLRIFAEMRRVPEESDTFSPNPEQRVYLEIMATEMADHAELLAYSGMRKEEATKSTVGDDHGDEFNIWGTKSASAERTIPVNAALRTVLDRIKSRRVGPKTKLVIMAEPRTAMRRACERLNLAPLRNHDLRHFFASVCIASGVDIPTISRWLGHADGGALAMKTYGHLLKDHSQAAAKKVDFNAPRVGAQSSVA